MTLVSQGLKMSCTILKVNEFVYNKPKSQQEILREKFDTLTGIIKHPISYNEIGAKILIRGRTHLTIHNKRSKIYINILRIVLYGLV